MTDEPNPIAWYLVVAPDGAVTAAGQCPASDFALQQPPPGGALLPASEAEAQQVAAGPGEWRVVDGTLQRVGVALATLKARAIAAIDAAAEAARRRWITPGAGQALEYQQTEREAQAYAAAGYPVPFDAADYPFVHAEMQAQADAGLLSLETQGDIDAAARAATDQILAEAEAWRAAGAEIKRLRRAAKMRVKAATTAADVIAAQAVSWPTP